jgi:hypothetical protein
MGGWRKSSFSESGNCLEVSDQGWRKSSASHVSGNCVEVGEEACGDYRKASPSVNNGQCAEVGSRPGGVLVRDTTDRDGTRLSFPAVAWAAFTARITGRPS